MKFFTLKKINAFTNSNFPIIYCASLKESKDRQENIKNQFLQFGIKSIQFLLSERFQNSDDIVEGENIKYIDDGTKGATVSHLKMIKYWYENTKDDYGFFCEDDLSLDTVQYWNFTWNEFIQNLPKNWDCIQLMCVREQDDCIKFRRRMWNDFSVGAYLISRKYAKVLIDSYIVENKFLLEFPEKYYWAPLAENLIYYAPKSVIDSKELRYNVYVLPLFVEEIKFNSTFFNQKSKYWGEDTGSYEISHKEYHIDSYHKVLNWWKNIGKNLSLDEILKL